MAGEQQTLDRPADLFRRMAEASPAVMALVSGPDNRVAYANRAFRRLAGSEAAGVVGRALTEILPDLDLAPIELARRTDAPVHRTATEMRLRHDAEPSWWDVAHIPMPEPEEGVSAVLVSAQDVTAHVLARREAEAARATLDALMAHIPEGITIVRGPGVHVERVSAHGAALARRDPQDLDDTHADPAIWDVYRPGSPDPLPAAERPLARAVRDGTNTVNETLLLRRADGSDVPVLCNCGPIRDAAGQITGAIMAWRDATELQAAQRALQQSQEGLRLALEAGGLGTWEIDLASTMGRIGAGLAAMLGLPPREVELDRPGRLVFVHPDDLEQMRAPFEEAVRTGQPYQSEFRIRTVDGRTRWLVCLGRIIQDAAGVPRRVVGVIRDVTEQRLREDKLREAVEARELLLREADHRIKNSLQLVGSVLSLQRSRLTDRDAREALDDAIARVRAVGEAHKALHQSTDLHSVAFADMLRDLCAHAGRLNPAVTVDCACAGEIELDTERAIPLGLIVSELLTNAAKHAYADGGVVQAAAALTDGLLEITVADRGVGMPDGPPANGLGSSIVRALTRQIGAEMEVASTPGEGSTVRLRFRP